MGNTIRESEEKEFSGKRKYTEENFENPTEEMENDLRWQIEWASWARANKKLKFYRTPEELWKGWNNE